MFLDVIRYFSPRHRVVREFANITNSGRVECFEFLRNNYRRVVRLNGINTFKEMSINYRIAYNRRNPRRIIGDFQRYVMGKLVHHRSDIAIAHNIMRSIGVHLSSGERVEFVDFLYNRVLELREYSNVNSWLKLRLINSSGNLVVRERVILDWVGDNLITYEAGVVRG